MLFPTLWRELLQFRTITIHTRVRNWSKKLKNHESKSMMSSWKYRKFGKKTTAQSASDFLQKHQTSEISLKTSDLMLNHQKWQHWFPRPCEIRMLILCHAERDNTKKKVWQWRACAVSLSVDLSQDTLQRSRFTSFSKEIHEQLWVSLARCFLTRNPLWDVE